MLHTDPRLGDAVSAAVGAIEARSDAEVVVVVAGRSSAWPEVAVGAAAVAGWLVVALTCWLPFVFHDAWIPVEAALGGLLVGLPVGRMARVVRAVVPARRLRARVHEAAEAAFVQEGVHLTERRTGVLVYVSALEGQSVVLCDQGVLARVPGGDLAQLRVDVGTVDALTASLARIGDILAAHLPATAHNRDEIANVPRVRR